MNGLFHAALEIQEFFQQRRWSFAIIGGLAVLRWGEPYATQDVDVTLLTGFGEEARYLDEILTRFSPRIAEAAEFAERNRVLLIRASNGVGIDVALAAISFEEELIRRASDHEFLPGSRLRTCSAEDLVVLKAFAGREKDWAAIRGVLTRQRGRLDWRYMESQLAPLCELKGEPEALGRLQAMRRQSERP